METNKIEKSFDTVKMMREIRDNLTLQTQDMTFEELKLYINKRMKESQCSPLGK